MDIKLISFPDKVTGASDATGKIAADDVNQIKKILNAVVSALFPLDNTNTATSAVLKAGALPAVDIFTNNFSTDFVVSGGVIALSGLPQLPIAPPLTNGVVDDDANTFTGTLPDGYAVTDLEATFNGGASWATITALPLEVGDVALAIGQVGLRIKATSEHQHSAALYNATAFTSSVVTSDPDAGFTQVILGSNDNLGQCVTQEAAPDNNNYDFANNGGTGSAPYGFLTLHAPVIPVGGAAIIRCTAPINKASFLIGVDTNYPSGTNNGLKASIRWIFGSSNSGKFQTVASQSYNTGNYINFTVTPRVQVRLTGTRIYMEYSLDGGATWIDTNPSVNTPQPQAILYLSGYTEGYASPADDAGIVNLLQSGLQ